MPISTAYQVAADIEKYHEFIHGMKPVNILEKGDNYMIASVSSRLLGGKVQMVAQFEKNRSIHFKQDNGPFKEFFGHWIFNEDVRSASVEFAMMMKHKSFIINNALSVLGVNLCEKVIKDFRKRAEEVSLNKAEFPISIYSDG